VDGLTRDDLRKLFALADSHVARSDALGGRVIGTVFLEPSSRTHGSFASATMQLGGSVLVLDANASSLAKGESVADTVTTWATYTDALVVRGNAGQFDMDSLRDALPPGFPVINAGYDVESHPTQALLDLYTIRQERGSLTGCTVGVYGDLKHSRTVRSLLRLLQLYDVAVVAIGAPEWQLPPDFEASLSGKAGMTVRRVDALRDAMPSLDVLYMTRTQTERLETSSAASPPAPLTPAVLALAKPSLILMHPLPRGPEFPDSVADDPRAVHVKQMANGLVVRKALLCLLMRV
jgi:aspartate carbamoyltransferase